VLHYDKYFDKDKDHNYLLLWWNCSSYLI